MADQDFVFALIPLVVVVGVLLLAALWIYRSSRLRELKQRQVLAMIERGLAPPPETAPLNVDGVVVPARRLTASDRFRSGGIIFVGIGLAVGLVIAVAGGQERVGLGVGAAIVAIGVAMIVNGLLMPPGTTLTADDASLPPLPPLPPSVGPRD